MNADDVYYYWYKLKLMIVTGDSVSDMQEEVNWYERSLVEGNLDAEDTIVATAKRDACLDTIAVKEEYKGHLTWAI